MIYLNYSITFPIFVMYAINRLTRVAFILPEHNLTCSKTDTSVLSTLLHGSLEKHHALKIKHPALGVGEA